MSLSSSDAERDRLEALEQAVSDLAELKTSPGWARLVGTINTRVDELRGSLTKRAQTASLEDVRTLQGTIDGLLWVRDLPTSTIDKLTAKATAGGERRSVRGH